MSKSNSGVAHASLDHAPPGEASNDVSSEAPNVAAAKLSPELFDERGRTVPWMARTVRRLYDALGQKILDRENLAIAYWYYLRVLAERGELNQLELSKRVGIASTTAVPALDNLEKRGLVQRVRDPKDRRKYYVSLKDEGRRLVDDILPAIAELHSTSLDGIAARDMQVFWKVAHQIEKNLIEMSRDDAALD